MTIGLFYNESSILRITASMSVTNNLLSPTILHSQTLSPSGPGDHFLSPHAGIIPRKLPRKPNAD